MEVNRSRLENMNKDRKLDSNEIKDLGDIINIPGALNQLRTNLEQNKSFMYACKVTFERTFKLIQEGNHSYTQEEIEIIKLGYEDLFHTELPWEFLGIQTPQETKLLEDFSEFLNKVDLDFLTQNIVSQSYVFNFDTLNIFFDDNITDSSKLDLKSKLDDFTKTSFGETILKDSMSYRDYQNKSNELFNGLGIKEVQQEDLQESLLIYSNYKDYFNQVEVHSSELNSIISHDWIGDFQSQVKSNPHRKAEDVFLEHKLEVTNAQSEFQEKVRQSNHQFAKQIGISLINLKPDIIKNGLVYDYNLGDSYIRLDFSCIKDKVSNFDDVENNELIKLFEENFKNIYRDNIIEKFSDASIKVLNNIKERPTETAIDATSIILGGACAVAFTSASGGLGVIQAGTAFTVGHETSKAVLYGVLNTYRNSQGDFDIKNNITNFFVGSSQGLGYDIPEKTESMTDEDYEKLIDKYNKEYLLRKGFEYSSNYALFSIFKVSSYATKSLAHFEQQLGKIGQEIYGLSRIPIEAVFFTGYQLGTGSIESALIDELYGTDESFFENVNKYFDNLSRTENLMEAFVFNNIFIGLIKGGTRLGGKHLGIGQQEKIDRLKNLEKKLLLNNERFSNMMNTLKSQGYSPIYVGNHYGNPDVVLRNPQGKIIDLKSPELSWIRPIMSEMSKQGKEYVKLSYQINKERKTEGLDDDGKNKNEQDVGAITSKGRMEQKPESGRGGIKGELSLSGKRLYDFLTGFNNKGKLDFAFEEMLQRGEFAKIEDISKIRDRIETKMRDEARVFLNRDLGIDDLSIIKSRADEFVLALKEKFIRENLSIQEIKSKYDELSKFKNINNKQKELKNILENIIKTDLFSSKYGEPNLMNRIMGQFTKELNSKLRSLLDTEIKDKFIFELIK